MSNIIFYNSYKTFLSPLNFELRKQIPGGEAFATYFQIFTQNVASVDRTGTVTTPMKIKLLDHLKIPKFTKFNKSFEEIVDNRSLQLLEQIKASNKKLAVMYSGGIDSTVIMCSIVKNWPKEDFDKVVVLLSDHSIYENPNFYNDYIIKNFECVSSYRFPYYLGNDNFLLINGENGDQIFGSAITEKYVALKGYDALFKPIEYAQGDICDFLSSRVYEGHEKYVEPCYNLFMRIVDNAPVSIDNVYKFWWWMNFTMKWQCVYVRMLPLAKNRHNIKLEENYTTFFSPSDFQLWCLNNTNNFIKQEAGMNGVKWIAKDYIVDVNKDEGYYNKPKIGSLINIFKQKEGCLIMNDDMSYTNDYPLGPEFINEVNSYSEMM